MKFAALSPLAGCLLFASIAVLADAQDNAPRGGGVQSLDQMFATLDLNRDGKISREEATGPFAQRFAQWDTDSDGFATREEIRAFRLRMGIDDNGGRISPNNPGKGKAKSRPSDIATILKEPTNWRLETMPVPTSFAPDIKLSGTEEIRFAPGMFAPDSDTYFSCVLAVIADGAPKLDAAALTDFLEKYYAGLSVSVGRPKGFSPDRAVMKATVEPTKPGEADHFAASVVFFDPFSDGRKITLNVEARAIAREAAKKTYLLLLVSPSAKDQAIWPNLREIEAKALANIPK